MGGLCLVMEFHMIGSATNGASQCSLIGDNSYGRVSKRDNAAAVATERPVQSQSSDDN